MCSLQGNLNNLQLLINNLGYKVSVIALSETWKSENKLESIKYWTIPAYHLYHEVKGKTLKGGHVFYMREDVKYKAINNLNISYFN